MTKEELLEKLAEIKLSDDAEVGHYLADLQLLAYIDDQEIALAFLDLTRWWYA
jgi:hypothetical protein